MQILYQFSTQIKEKIFINLEENKIKDRDKKRYNSPTANSSE